MNDKRCRVCGDEMECYDYGGGSVWSCGTHGVCDWQFSDMGAQWMPRPPAVHGRGAAPPPAPPAKPGELPRHGRGVRAS